MKMITNIVSTYLENPNIFISTIVLIVLCVLITKYYPKFRGFMGEFWVKLELKKLPKNKYVILNDIMIRDEMGTHQIDHIVLSKFGIFVIEMKNYYGLIKGNEYDNKWCQYLGKNKNYFLNPIHQNYGHIKSLSKLLNIDKKYFISIICFSNQAKVKVKCNNIVTNFDNINNNILKFNNEFCDYDINKLYEIIISNNIVDRKSRNQHIKDIHNKLNYENELLNNMICPRCGNKLIEKNGKYGRFISCCNYPKCNYIKR